VSRTSGTLGRIRTIFLLSCLLPAAIAQTLSDEQDVDPATRLPMPAAAILPEWYVPNSFCHIIFRVGALNATACSGVLVARDALVTSQTCLTSGSQAHGQWS